MIRALRCLCCASLALLLIGGPGVARAGFVPANDVVAVGGELDTAGFGMDPGGTAIVAWNERPTPLSPFEAKARMVRPGGALGPVIALSPGKPGYSPEVGVAPTGRAFVAWRVLDEVGPSSVVGRWVEPDGSLGPERTLVEAIAGVVDPVDVRVAVDPSGVATVTWRNQKGNTIGLRRVQPDSTLGTPVADVSGGSGAIDHQMAALPNGSTVVVWRVGGNSISKNVITTGLSVGTPQTIGVPSAAGPSIAVDSLGNGLVTWRHIDAAEERSARGRLLDPTGAAVGGELVIDPPGPTFVGTAVRPSADSVGNFLVTWTRQDGNNKAVVYGRGLDATGTFAGPPQPLSPAGSDSVGNRAALLDAGVSPVTWSSAGGAFAREVGPSGAPISAPAPLSGGSAGPVAAAPAIGAAAVLIERTVSPGVIAAEVRRFLAAPVCADAAATVVQGRPVAAPVACSGPFIQRVEAVDQPLHGSVTAAGPGGLVYTPRPGYDGPDSFTYRALNEGGASAPARVSIDVGKDDVRPQITRLKLVRKKGKGGKLNFRFELAISEPAMATVRIERLARTPKGKPRFKKLGKAAAKNPTQKPIVKVTGKLRSKLRAGGRFRATAIAIDPASNESKPRRLRFRVAAR